MFDDMLKSILSFVTHRLFIIFVLVSLMFGLLVNKIFTAQIVNGEKYLKDFELRITQERKIPATRGNIYDRNGKLLAQNKLAYSVMIDDSFEVKDKNEMLFKLIKIIEKNHDKIISEFPIIINENNELAFNGSEASIKQLKKSISEASKKDLSEKIEQMSAEEILNYLSQEKFFDIDQKKYNKQEIIKILTLRFALWKNRYHKYQQVIIAKDINQSTLAHIKEHSTEFPGVEIIQDSIRYYNNPEYFAHIIGYIGQISEDELTKLDSQGKDNYDGYKI